MGQHDILGAAAGPAAAAASGDPVDRVVEDTARAIAAANRRRTRWWNMTGRAARRVVRLLRTATVALLRRAAGRLPRWTGVWRIAVLVAVVEILSQIPRPPGLQGLAFGPSVATLADPIDAVAEHVDGVRDPIYPQIAGLFSEPWAPLTSYCVTLTVCAAITRRSTPRRPAGHALIVLFCLIGFAVTGAYALHLAAQGFAQLAAELRTLTLAQLLATLIATGAIFLTAAGYKPTPRYRR